MLPDVTGVCLVCVWWCGAMPFEGLWRVCGWVGGGGVGRGGCSVEANSSAVCSSGEMFMLGCD